MLDAVSANRLVNMSVLCTPSGLVGCAMRLPKSGELQIAVFG